MFMWLALECLSYRIVLCIVFCGVFIFLYCRLLANCSLPIIFIIVRAKRLVIQSSIIIRPYWIFVDVSRAVSIRC